MLADPTPTVSTSTAPRWTDAWTEALDTFDMSLAEAAQLVSTGQLIDSAFTSSALAWSAPTNLGPLPDSLRERASRILERQLAIAAQLTEAARAARQHLKVVDDLTHRAPSVPVYIDTVG